MKPGIFIVLLIIYALIIWSPPAKAWELDCTIIVRKHHKGRIECIDPNAPVYLPAWSPDGPRIKFYP